MRTLGLASVVALACASMAWMACSSSDTTPPPAAPTSDAGGDDGGGGGSVFTLSNPCTDSLDSIYADPGALPADKGAIIKCAKDDTVTKDALQAKAVANVSGDSAPATNAGYTGKALTSGYVAYRILYRTERGDTASSPGYSSAKIYIPDTPRAAGKMPLVVGARGSRGQAPSCVASKEDPSAVSVNGDYEALADPIVGAGFPIIVPDLAGYAAPFEDAKNPISGYAAIDDVGKGTLDGARAALKLLPSGLNGKTVLLGHSQGGHSALASLALAPSYAPDLNIVAIATYSPLWVPQRNWGAIFFESKTYPIAGSEGPNGVSIWYHYTHGELLDGPGHGTDMFAADKKAAVKAWVEGSCWGQWDGLRALGTTALDVYDPAFVSSLQNPAALGTSEPFHDACASGDAVCTKWMDRYEHDRPHLTNVPPLLINYGSNDLTIPPTQMACVIDRLKNQDGVSYQFCLEPDVGHGGVVRKRSSYVADWIASQTLGEAAPAACAMTDADLVTDAGGPVKCPGVPSNL